MSLNGILSNAITGLNAAQGALRTSAHNISNVNTPGYVRQVAALESVALGGQGAGVRIAEVRRVVDEFLQRELRVASADAARYQSISQLHQMLQGFLGDPMAKTSVNGRLDQVFAALGALASEPTSAARRAAALSDIDAFGVEITRIAAQIQTLRAEADRQVGADVARINDLLQRIHDLNKRVTTENISGRETVALQDERDRSIAELSGILDIRVDKTTTGMLTISTGSGMVLLDEALRTLSYSNPGTVEAGTRFEQITLHRVHPVTGAVEETGRVLDPGVTSGSLRGWLDMRDTALPAVAAELGQLAAGFADALNEVHNQGVAVPPPASLTGRDTGLLGTDLHGFTGSVSFHVFDADNAAVTSMTVDFDALPPGATIADVVTAVNAALGGAGSLVFSDGVMSFTAGGAAAGVGIQQEAPGSARGGRGFSHFFGMNDLVTAQAPAHHDTGLTGAAAHGLTGQVTLQARGPNNEVPREFVLDFDAAPLSAPGATMNDVLAALNGAGGLGTYFTFSLDADGALLAAPKAGYQAYRLEPVEDGSQRGGTGQGFAALFGLGHAFEAGPAGGLSVRADIKAVPGRLALARVENTTPALTAGDGRGAAQLQALAQASRSFAAAGGLAAMDGTITGYAERFLSTLGRSAAAAETLGGDRELLRTELETRMTGVSGVNLDEELANMVVLQNAYNASARLISAAREMYDVLLRM